MKPLPSARRKSEAGVTLVEVLVALAIFALIGAAGFGMLDQVVRVERLSEARFQRLESMQRMMRVISVDFAQARPDSVAGQGASVRLSRSSTRGGAIALDYGVRDGQLVRSLVGAGGTPRADQVLLGDVSEAEWLFLDPAGVWHPNWPPSDDPSLAVASSTPPPSPRAVALTLRLEDGSGLRRVALMSEAIR